MKYKTVTVMLALFITALSAIANAQTYSITDLGTLSPAAINNWGQIAAVNLSKHAVVRTAGRVRDLGVFPGGAYSIPTEINDLGAVVGVADQFVTYNNPGYPAESWAQYLPQGFVWSPSKGMQSVGYIPALSWGQNFQTSNFAEGINAFGQVIVDTYCCTYINGYVWTQAGTTMVSPYTYNAEAFGINNRGQVVGWNGVSPMGQDLKSRASLWDNGVLTELGSLLAPSDWVVTSCSLWSWDTSTGCGSVAYDINDFGQVVGWSAYNLYNSGYSSDYVQHAFLWTQSGGMEDLGTLPGDLSSEARKINVFGQIIGSSYPEASIYHQTPGRPFIWTRQGQMQDLNTLISASSAWVLQSVADINAWGQIVGQGLRYGQPHGFLLTPKNPFQF